MRQIPVSMLSHVKVSIPTNYAINQFLIISYVLFSSLARYVQLLMATVKLERCIGKGSRRFALVKKQESLIRRSTYKEIDRETHSDDFIDKKL